MRANEMRRLLKAEPFKPIRVGLSDGRSIIVRHPDQAVVSEQKLIVGVARVERSRPSVTPRSGDTIAKDWIMVDLLHIVSVEPGNGRSAKQARKQRGK